MGILNSGDVVDYASAEGTRRGQVLDVRFAGDPTGGEFTYVVILDGVREPITTTDRTSLTKIAD